MVIFTSIAYYLLVFSTDMYQQTKDETTGESFICKGCRSKKRSTNLGRGETMRMSVEAVEKAALELKPMDADAGIKVQEGSRSRRIQTVDIDLESLNLGVLDFATISPFFALQKKGSVNDILESKAELPESSPDQGSWNAIKGHYGELIEYCKQMKEQIRLLKKELGKADMVKKDKNKPKKVTSNE